MTGIDEKDILSATDWKVVCLASLNLKVLYRVVLQEHLYSLYTVFQSDNDVFI